MYMKSMKDNMMVRFTAWTFLIMMLGWGICIISGQFGITLKNHLWLYAPFFLGGWSPTIASYIVLKRSNQSYGYMAYKQPYRLLPECVHSSSTA